MEEEGLSDNEPLWKSSTFYGTISSTAPIKTESLEIEKPNKVKYTSTQWLTIITLAFANFCTGACISLQAPFFPAEAELKGATPTEYGFIFGIFQLTLFVMAPVMGKLVAIVSPKLVLNTGVLTLGVTCVAFGLLDYCKTTTTFVTLAFVIRTFEGIGAAALRTSCYTIVASQFIEEIGTTFASLEIFLGIGLIIGPTLGGVLYDLGGYGLPFYAVGAIVIVDALIIFFCLPDVERKNLPGRGSLLKFWLHPLVLIFSLSVFSAFNFLGFIQATLEPHIRQFHLSGVYIGMIFALIGIVYGLGAPFWGWLCDHMCNSNTLSVLGCLLQIVSILFMGPAPFFKFQPAIYLVIPSIIIYGLALASKNVCAFTGMLKEAAKRGLPPGLATYGLVSAMIASSQSLGAFVGPCFGGFLSEEFGFRKASMAFLVLEFILVFLFICFHFTLSRQRNSMDLKQHNVYSDSTSSSSALQTDRNPEVHDNEKSKKKKLHVFIKRDFEKENSKKKILPMIKRKENGFSKDNLSDSLESVEKIEWSLVY